MASQSWRSETRKNYTNDFKLRMVKLASQHEASVAQIAREHGINDNLIFKWLRLWQNEGRISRRLPATVATVSSPALLPVEVISAPTQSGDHNATTCQPYSLNATSCHVEFCKGKMTLNNPSPELLAMLIHELTGRTAK